MKKERKEYLLGCFPEVPYSALMVMHSGKESHNFIVFLASQNMLFIRGFHRFSNGKLEERQRYVFADDGCVRYGFNQDGTWSVRCRFSEPKFYFSYYGYSDNSYSVLCKENIHKTCMRYSGAELYSGNLLISYLKFWQKHKNAEYLVKTGYSELVENDIKWHGSDIDWSSNNLLKMLHLNRAEFKALQGRETRYFDLKRMREGFPELAPEEILEYSEFFGYRFGTLTKIQNRTSLSIKQIYNYFQKENLQYIMNDYFDYIEECKKLGYDLTSRQINRPKNFRKAHERTAEIIRYERKREVLESFECLKPEREFLEFSDDNLFIRQPESYDEIVAEGKILHHCVGGYAERHSMGKLHIMFIRSRDKPDIPYYTMEISTDGKIVQVRGVRNAPPTEEVSEFTELYRVHLAEIFSKKERKSA